SGVVHDNLYVAGGQTPTSPFYTDVHESYDPSINSWSAKQPLPVTRAHGSGDVAQGKFYVMGGVPTGRQTINHEYDPAINSWSTKAPMPTGRSYLAAGSVQDKLYVIGGIFASNEFRTNEEYDPATNVWTTKA